jgi:anthranilate synthase component I
MDTRFREFKNIINDEKLFNPLKTVLKTNVKKHLSDTLTPVSAYLRLRDQYSGTVLLESTDFRSAENCLSIIGLETMAYISVKNGVIETDRLGKVNHFDIQNRNEVMIGLQSFSESFSSTYNTDYQGFNGLLGFTGFDAIQYFEKLNLDFSKKKNDVPDLYYALYRYILVFNHYNDELTILENTVDGESSKMERLETLLFGKSITNYPFETVGTETSNLTDDEYLELVRKGKKHCHRGDVFQIVLSRQFQQQFLGDDFNVYRRLRSINPSPYLFYFDFGSYKIFGSSPEAQLVVNQRIAQVNPIAGTYKRTGDDEADRLRAQALQQDPKEQSEHIMLVDLARNDLGKHCKQVAVETLKEIQYFSHVIHLVSKVTGTMNENTTSFQLLSDTFPAGTLSGAPKYRALELISEYENQNRGIYGGALGLIDFNGNMNQAIIIRSFLSKNNTLFYQAGAGVVATSNEESELQEVNNKINALRKAVNF